MQGDELVKTETPGCLFVGGLPLETDEKVLEKQFGHYGRLTKISVKRDKNSQACRGFAFITFETAEDAKDAIKGLHNKEILGNQVDVRQAYSAGTKVVDVEATSPATEVVRGMGPLKRFGSRGMRGGPRGGSSYDRRGGGGGRGRMRGGGGRRSPPPRDRGMDRPPMRGDRLPPKRGYHESENIERPVAKIKCNSLTFEYPNLYNTSTETRFDIWDTISRNVAWGPCT